MFIKNISKLLELRLMLSQQGNNFLQIKIHFNNWVPQTVLSPWNQQLLHVSWESCLFADLIICLLYSEWVLQDSGQANRDILYLTVMVLTGKCKGIAETTRLELGKLNSHPGATPKLFCNLQCRVCRENFSCRSKPHRWEWGPFSPLEVGPDDSGVKTH